MFVAYCYNVSNVSIIYYIINNSDDDGDGDGAKLLHIYYIY
jgi:hypothetical protein